MLLDSTQVHISVKIPRLLKNPPVHRIQTFLELILNGDIGYFYIAHRIQNLSELLLSGDIGHFYIALVSIILFL